MSHGLTDGFEGYSLSDSQLLDASQADKDCEKLLHSVSNLESALGLLPEAGVGTLRLLSEFALNAKLETPGEPSEDKKVGEKVFVASDFWKESPIDTSRGVRPFGQYGEVGKHANEGEDLIHEAAAFVLRGRYQRIARMPTTIRTRGTD